MFKCSSAECRYVPTVWGGVGLCILYSAFTTLRNNREASRVLIEQGRLGAITLLEGPADLKQIDLGVVTPEQERNFFMSQYIVTNNDRYKPPLR